MGVKLDSLNSLFVEQLKDLYSAETQLVDALPKMAKAASSPQLQQAFEQHLEQTRGHVQRIEQVFQGMDHKPSGEKCEGMAGLLKEGEKMIKKKGKVDDDVLDAGLIAAAQRVEHYEIAGYGTVCSFANLLGKDNEARILHQTLDEEKKTDDKLTKLAQSTINKEALA